MKFLSNFNIALKIIVNLLFQFNLQYDFLTIHINRKSIPIFITIIIIKIILEVISATITIA